jgi:hypothetical protein
MKNQTTIFPFLFVALVLSFILVPVASSAKDIPQLTWNHYYDQDQVTDALHQMADTWPELTELYSVGESAEGRKIWCLTITNEKTGAPAAKPAMYVDGAIHGNEIQATEVCLYTAWTLLTRYGEWEKITTLLDRSTFYIIPTVNVDNRAHFFTDPNSYNIGRSARIPYDDDRDGLFDEDSYDDLDGDGMILQMRIRDENGAFKTHPDDPRVMVRIKPGEKGEWRRLGMEGLDNDEDGRVNEDTPGYLDMNRNWGFQWQPRYIQNGSGDFPFSASNTRAVAGFLADHPNICFGFAFHNYGGMFLRGPGSELAPPLPAADLGVFDYLGQAGERTVPGYRYLVSMSDLYTTYGDFDEFLYQIFGIYGFVGELYMSSQVAYRGHSDKTNGPAGNLWSRRPGLTERQEFNDHLMMGEMFTEWKTFQHPTYGEIEIGGWRPFSVRISPSWMLPDMLHRNAMFVIWTATQMPRMELSITEVKDLGDGLHRIRARVVNRGALPTLSVRALGKKLYRQDLFTIEGGAIDVLSGGLLLDEHFDTTDPARHRLWRVSTSTPAFGSRQVQWIVSGSGDFTVSYDGVKCGKFSADGSVQ